MGQDHHREEPAFGNLYDSDDSKSGEVLSGILAGEDTGKKRAEEISVALRRGDKIIEEMRSKGDNNQAATLSALKDTERRRTARTGLEK